MNSPHRLLVVLLVAAGCCVLAVGCVNRPRPTDPQAGPSAIDLYVQGVQAYRTGDEDTAVVRLEEAVQKDPELRMARSMLGDIYRRRGDYSNASMQYEAASRLDPYTPANHYNLGVTYQLLNRLQDAAGSYLRALKLEPNDARTHMNLGTVYLAMGRFDESVAHLERSTQLDPDSSMAWTNLGVAMDARGSPVLAEAAYRRSLELDGLSPATIQNLAANLIAQGKGAEAVALTEQLLKENDTIANRKRHADALAVARRYDESLRTYDRVLELDPRYIPALNDKAATYIRMYRDGLGLDDGKRTAALELWRTSLRLNANQPRVREQLTRWENPPLFSN